MNTEPPAPRPRSLRRTVVLGVLPLCVVLAAAVGTQWHLVTDMHREVQRSFEEQREVALARTLVDALLGIHQWVVAAPSADRSQQALLVEDVRRHYETARASLARFPVPDDPSRLDHEAAERTSFAKLAEHLDRIGAALAAGKPLTALADDVGGAQQHAQVLAQMIESELLTIGDNLDAASELIVRVLLVLGLACAVTLAGFMLLVQRRVLQPVRALRDAAARLGRGELDTTVPATRRDELGDLAGTFQEMAGRLLRHRQELEQRVEERSREVLRGARLAQLGSIAAGIAHEINNPLASIVACTDGLLRDLRGRATPDVEGMREYLEILRKEAMRTRDITLQLLRLAHQGEGRRERLWLADEAREVAALFAHQLEDAGVTLHLVADEGSAAILGDPAEWHQVLFNLLRNALDASPRGGVILLACRKKDGELHLVVEDDGPGVPAADAERIFEPFFTTKDPGRGTGLGLAIVHRIVTAHGGRVSVQRGTRGARFVVAVPTVAAAA